MATACPQCGASVRTGAPYCSLCHADFRPRPAVVEPPAPTIPSPAAPGIPAAAAQATTSFDPLTAPLLDIALPQLVPAQGTAPAQAARTPVEAAPVPRAEPRWPCLSCQVSNPMSADVCSTCGSPFLAAAHEELSVVVPGVGDLMKLSRGQRFALAGGVLTVVLVPVALITMLLSPSAPPPAPSSETVTTVAP